MTRDLYFRAEMQAPPSQAIPKAFPEAAFRTQK